MQQSAPETDELRQYVNLMKHQFGDFIRLSNNILIMEKQAKEGDPTALRQLGILRDHRELDSQLQELVCQMNTLNTWIKRLEHVKHHRK